MTVGASWIAIAAVVLATQDAGRVVLDNAYVQVTRNGAPCAPAAAPTCGERVVVALGPIELATAAGRRQLVRGEIAVVPRGEPYTPPAQGEYVEVVLKPHRPTATAPPVRLAPEGNVLLYDGPDFFVFEERLAPGDLRPRHSHSQRVVIVLNATRLEQWPEGQPALVRTQIPDEVRFNEAVVHTVKTIGDQPLRNIVIELKR